MLKDTVDGEFTTVPILATALGVSIIAAEAQGLTAARVTIAASGSQTKQTGDRDLFQTN
jgi:hypothetical protein